MVYYFTSLHDDGYTIYMGKDKLENETLIKYGWPEDVWFHVDDLSSAHVYLRMKPEMTLDDIPQDILTECAALTKANSIQGCKKASVYIVYTRWKNLKKTADMVDGQVGFHRPDNVRRIQVEKNNTIVRQLEKSKREENPDLAALQQGRLDEIQRQKKHHFLQLKKEKEAAKMQAEAERQERSYDRLYDPSKLTAVSDMAATADATAAEEYEDDFF